MKKILLPLLLLLYCSNVSAQQFTWIPVPSGSQYNIHQLSFPNDSIGFAVADTVDLNPSARILKTSNRGITWSQVNFVYYAMANIHAPDANTIYVNGNNGSTSVLRKSVNGGQTWATINFSAPEGPMEFLNQQTGFIVTTGGGANRLNRTMDGGVTFDTATMTGAFASIYAFEVVSDSILYAGGLYGPKLAKTTQQLSGWSDLSNDYAVRSLCFLDPDTGYAVAEFIPSFSPIIVYKTTDGGLNWQPLAGSADPGGAGWTKIHCRNEQDCMCVGGGGMIGVTGDGGFTWTFEPAGTTQILEDVFYGSNYAVAIGEQGTIIRRVPVVTGLATTDQTPVQTIFPNPAVDFLEVTGSFLKNDILVITDVSGRQLSEDIISDNAERRRLELNQLVSGTYFLLHNRGNKITSTRFLVSN